MKYLLILFAVIISSCSSTKYVPVESVSTDSVYIYSQSVDTILAKDSIYIERTGDTLREVRYLWRYKVKERIDTCYIERCDTVSMPLPVEKELTAWERTKQEAGGIAIGCVTAMLCCAVVWLVRRFKTRK